MVSILLKILFRLLAPLNGALGTGTRSSWQDACAQPGRLGDHAAGIFRLGLFVLLAALTIPAPAVALLPANNTPIASLARLESLGRTHTAQVDFIFLWNTPSAIEFLQYTPSVADAERVQVPVTEYRSGTTGQDGFSPLQPPLAVGGESISLNELLPLLPGTLYHEGEPVFVRVKDLDQNRDPTLAETIIVALTTSANDTETLRLTETGPNSGIFIGYIQTGNSSATPFNGLLTVGKDSTAEGRYVDPQDSNDAATASILFDPFGIVFDSRTGLPINDAVVTLMDETTGGPAHVFGDDAVSLYPATVTTGGTVLDASGTVYQFGPGRFRFPFVAPGRYRLVVDPPPGYAVPSQVSIPELQTLPSAPWALTEGSYGLSFEVKTGPALRVDIPADPYSTRIWLQKTVDKTRAAPGDFVPYRLQVQNPDTVHSTRGGIVLTDRLPPGFRYMAGSARRDGLQLSEPNISADGRTLTFTLGDLAALQTAEIFYVVEVGAGARPGKAINTAVAIAEGISSNTAEATLTVGEDFFRSTTFLLGRVHTGGCGELQAGEPDGLEEVRIYLEDGTYVLTDKDGMFHFDGVRPGVHVVQLDRESLPDYYEPVACEENTRFAGQTDSQFVDLQGGSLWRTDFYLKMKPLPRGDERITMTGIGETAPIATNATAASQAEAIEETSHLETVRGESGPIAMVTEGLHPGEIRREELRREKEEIVGILYPVDGTYIAAQIAAVRVRLDSRLKPVLFLDGQEIPAERIGFKMEDKETRKTLYSYIGVDFGEPGKHVLKLQGRDPFGNARVNQEVNIVRTGEIAAIRLLGEGENIADGRTPVTFRLEILDTAGKRIKAPVEIDIREGNLKPFGHKVTEIPTEQTETEILKVLVDAEGVAHFAPVTTSGLYQAVLGYNKAELKLETYVQPLLRDWIMVGLAEGTVGYNTVAGNKENLPQNVDERLYEDGRVAFFGKGRILGKWLLTMAYDSGKPDRKDKELFQVIDPDSYYTLYGDASQQSYEAASAEKIYVKLERAQFNALFGDFNTGLDQAELSRYSRALTGLKSEYHGRYFVFNGFASETDQAFVKDEIRGDGTSGLYRLSRPDIVINSETIRIEIRNRFRSDVIISTQTLTRHTDYNIDYEAGTLFFKEPISSQDENFNPVYIVVDYETRGAVATALNYGGRAAVRLPEAGIEIGATTIHEQQDRAEGNLWGVDGKWEMRRGTVLRGEIAGSTTEDEVERREGSAWLAELAHQDGRLAGTLYYREQEEGFGLGQQKASEAGTRKIGTDAAWTLSQAWSLKGQIYRQYNLETDAIRDVAEASANYKVKDYSLAAGIRHAVDEFADGEERTSSQGLIGGTWQAYERLLLRAAHEQSLPGHDENSDFPTRTLLGADFKLTTATTLFAAQEWTQASQEKTESTRVGLKTTPWTGGQIDTALEQQAGEFGPRMFALFGLKQNLRLNDRWSLNGGFDRSSTIRKPGARDFDEDVPPAAGSSEDFSAVFLGATSTTLDWTWENRLEWRDSDSEKKKGLFTSLIGEVRKGLGMSARAQIFKTDMTAGRDKTNGEIRLGLAYRPNATRWIVLDRLEYRFESDTGDKTSSDSWRLINNLNANYRPDRRTQISLQYGAKYVREQIDEQSFQGFTDLLGLEGRYDLDKHWDIGLRGSVLHSWNSGALDYSAGPSIGYNIVKNAWVSAGYNIVGFYDPDFSRADFTAQGPFMKFRCKFDQNSLRDALKHH